MGNREEVKTPFCLLEAPSLFSRFKPWIVQVLGKVSHPRSVSWAFPTLGGYNPCQTHTPFLFLCPYIPPPGKRASLARRFTVCNSPPAEFCSKTDWLCLLVLPVQIFNPGNSECLVLGSAQSDFRGTHPSKLCLCPRLVPAGVGSSPSGQHKMGDGQTWVIHFLREHTC